MAFWHNNAILSALRLHSQRSGGPAMLSRRGFHVELGAREKALLAEDQSLQRFKSPNNTVRRLKRVGDVLTAMVVAGMVIFATKILHHVLTLDVAMRSTLKQSIESKRVGGT